MKIANVIILIAVAVVLMGAGASGEATAPYEINWSTIEAGGVSSGGPYFVKGVIGQADAGLMTGGPYELAGGFTAGGMIASGVGDTHNGGPAPAAYRLYPNVPNPFNPSTSVQFQLPHDERVRLQVYDVAGRLVNTLVDGRRPAGTHASTWDGTDTSGRQVASGVYLLVMEAGSFQDTRKITLLK